MKVLYEKDLKSGYKLRVVMDEEFRLATTLSTSKDEYVSQLYTSDETIIESVSRMSNYELTLTADEAKTIKEAKEKPKSESFNLLRYSMMNKKD